ncbi:MAG TPA: tRNA lysidine(34) synthetase TilS [Xanthomonadaceae bacterium]|nr:tRNA lysidine(34) synthetase TilS [Xanthomonadaceae bacterium]
MAASSARPLQIAAPDRPDDTGRAVVVGFSGGADSSVLLHLLTQAGWARARGLRAVHVHHGLHAQADAWAGHCQQVCATLGVPLWIVQVTVVRDGQGPEAAARKARHAAFEDELQDGEVLALAQHRDDQAETFLLRALRASGPDGLAAMRPWRRFGRGWLWRPLLDVPRADLQAYAQAHGLHWIEDPSNADDRIERNLLRLRVLPVLRKRWPQADAALARSATLCAQAADLLVRQDARLLAGCTGASTNELSVAALRQLDPAARARVLRHWIDMLGLPALPARGVAAIENDLLPARSGSAARFNWSRATVRRWREDLHAQLETPLLPVDWRIDWDGRTPLALPCGGSLQLIGVDAFDVPLQVHARRGGERIRLPGRTHSHALKHVLQEAGVPPWRRARMPLLSDSAGTVLAAGDAILAAGFADWLDARAARLHWHP